MADKTTKGGKSRKRASATADAPHAVTAVCNRAEDGVKHVQVGAEWVSIRRRIAGMDTVVNVPTLSYRGVTLKAPPGGAGYEIWLMHVDPSLDLVLARAVDDCDIIALWRTYGRMLGIALLVEDQDGRLQPIEERSGTPSFARRFGSPLKDRRPRFLAHRLVGLVATSGASPMPVHSGEHEMFAYA